MEKNRSPHITGATVPTDRADLKGPLGVGPLAAASAAKSAPFPCDVTHLPSTASGNETGPEAPNTDEAGSVIL